LDSAAQAPVLPIVIVHPPLPQAGREGQRLLFVSDDWQEYTKMHDPYKPPEAPVAKVDKKTPLLLQGIAVMIGILIIGYLIGRTYYFPLYRESLVLVQYDFAITN
jgi:hypothetical protein